MGRTSAKVTNRYHAKAYDIVNATLPKGYVAKLREHCEKQGKSVSASVVEQCKKMVEEDSKEE